ncbi:hypothetical protein WH52_12320 [Tenacibaculum holothuriorum]|uniref:SMODS and SLOG-associating 2TM effector domain-containing protein n=1 Tax=Tenacibaculum holothuriorum TaxID=1635173 RepID=A0A1Y2PB61_9FLAO|nr:DUF4231 domain-containing protein [Tenacibaculum holothuriorum]OSY87241.1 hypothetical protein WH52_12320 [Tenacibaculum holothuriorum]
MQTNLSRFEILQEEIVKMIEFSSCRTKQNKKKSFRIYISIAISSALITFLVAVGDDFPDHKTIIKILTLFFSAMSTIFAAWDGFYNHKDLWVIYGETRDRLKELHLKTKLASIEEKNDSEYITQIHKDFQAIVNKGSFKWKELRMEENGN